MKTLFDRASRFLAAPLDLGPRGLLLVATLLLVPAYLAPLWKMMIFAPQAQDGLRLSLYSYKLEGGRGGQDIREINALNRSIGMREVAASDFSEFQWMPFVLGTLGLLFLRCAAIGTISSLVDVFVLYVYFGLFSLWSFGYTLYDYGHNLAPTAAVRVVPFMPPLFGHREIAKFDVSSYPGPGSYALVAVALALAGALVLAVQEERSEERAQARVAG